MSVPIRKYAVMSILVAILVYCYADLKAQTNWEGTPLAFLPLASVKIHVIGAGRQRLDDALRKFADAEHLHILRDEVQREKWTIYQSKIELDSSTFFYMSNALQADQFKLTAYSHGKKQDWFPIWTRLLNLVSGEVGLENVVDNSTLPVSK